jgi:hypothetical protein
MKNNKVVSEYNTIILIDGIKHLVLLGFQDKRQSTD